MEEKQKIALASLPEDAPWLTKLLVKHRRVVGILIPLLFFETLWWLQVDTDRSSPVMMLHAVKTMFDCTRKFYSEQSNTVAVVSFPLSLFNSNTCRHSSTTTSVISRPPGPCSPLPWCLERAWRGWPARAAAPSPFLWWHWSWLVLFNLLDGHSATQYMSLSLCVTPFQFRVPNGL